MINLIAGVDEVGRGPLAGPLVAAAVVFPEGLLIEGIHDSKLLSESRLKVLSRVIRSRSSAWAIGGKVITSSFPCAAFMSPETGQRNSGRLPPW